MLTINLKPIGKGLPSIKLKKTYRNKQQEEIVYNSSVGGGSELEMALNQRTSNMNDFFVRDETWKQIRHIIQLHTIECHSAVCTV